jgi:phage-related protein
MERGFITTRKGIEAIPVSNDARRLSVVWRWTPPRHPAGFRVVSSGWSVFVAAAATLFAVPSCSPLSGGSGGAR